MPRPLKTCVDGEQRQLVRHLRLGIVIAADDEDPDAGLVEPAQFASEKQRGVHRGLAAIIKVAGDQQGIDLFGKAKIDDPHKRLPGRTAHDVGELGISKRKAAQRGIKMKIGGVNEAEGHGRPWPVGAAPVNAPDTVIHADAPVTRRYFRAV